MGRNPDRSRATFRAMRSKRHVIETLEIDRKFLTAFNDKVFQVGPMFSRPLGHWRNKAEE